MLAYSMANRFIKIERMSEQAHIPHALTLLENTAHKNCQYHALVMTQRTENHLSIEFQILIFGCSRSYELAGCFDSLSSQPLIHRIDDIHKITIKSLH